ncbi:MAG: hypothetical protein CMN05_15325 [Roseibacillus sp.]|jgi:hypothetical protein|nr:hypothetical protein [Roseibacillus sp.]MBP34533.1 hypothetical protein [Roseibacillus sp.]MDP7106456.1 hypothetical protein [Roseibacillus sp.]MDP7307033.1 hypothetical protein [Roseibacillus sp.]MDP7656724.1 hypothetical protein [Roseibacillus sp.]|tara:strand:+ start:1102 stop:2487 length:1386 start_codon:yes stop_codon:yes gene_type:complete
MKQSALIPILVLTAGVAFGLGWIAKPNGNGDQANENNRGGSKSGVSSLRPSGPGSSSSGSGRVGEFLAQYTAGGTISPEDMTAAIEQMRKENDPILRRKLFTELLENLTPENAQAAYLALQSGRRGWGRGGGDDELRLLSHAWGRIDGPGAIKALTEMRAERENGEGGRGRGGDRGGFELVSVLSGWASADGKGAADYVSGIEDDREQRMLAFGVVRGMMVNGVDEAMGYVASLPKTEDGDRAQSWYMSTIAGEMLEEGLDSAKAWVDSINDPDLKGGALSRVAESAVREDLEGAVEWVTQYAGEEAGQRAVNRVADEWAEDDPQAVLTWADSLPDAARAEAYGEAFQEWTRQDATAAGEYLTNMEPSPARDSAVEEFSTTLSREEPATAIKWAETISNEETRTDALTQVARSWYYRDREAATQWLETSGLPEESVQAVTADRQSGRGRGPGGGGGPPRGR